MYKVKIKKLIGTGKKGNEKDKQTKIKNVLELIKTLDLNGTSIGELYESAINGK